ncbi:hypothetical protein GQ44DRAFT_726154 [Phaeosphaeriaceae sp. PMI808]|nr:hypothetical protein GQ44DRAFT_726154 [Phaeosphaeriaceae sp. PMI808]
MATEILTSQLKSSESQKESHGSYPREPLQLKGALDHYQSFDVTPVIGREFINVNLKEWLQAPSSDALIRDLAVTSAWIRRVRAGERIWGWILLNRGDKTFRFFCKSSPCIQLQDN